jgi:hypothetical protein
MLNDKLETEISRDKLLYWIGRYLGLFPENSFNQYKHLFLTENVIHSMLATIYKDLQHIGILATTKDDKIIWNNKFNIDNFVASLEKRKEAQIRQTQARVKVKSAIRRSIVPGQVIKNSGLTIKITNVNTDLLEIKTIIQEVNEEWSKIFKVGFEPIWKYIKDVENQSIFGTDSQFETIAQNLMILENGKISFERDIEAIDEESSL